MHRQHLLSGIWVRITALVVLLTFVTTSYAEEPSSTPRDGVAPPASAKTAEKYWAYRPIVRPEPPAVQNHTAIRTPIDRFILQPLESQGLEYSPVASREEFLRRAKFDLHGLPPSVEERDLFLADDSPEAYDRLINRLLDSPHYGERWGRMWLDVVRFADSAGYNADPVRPLAFQYRDYVIRSFNQDKGYDRFILEQLAGDELFPDEADALIATGFVRLPPDESNASNILLARQDQLNDLTTAVGAIFLGQSLGCAQCHDHKFDAILQKDFYRIQAFFAGITPNERAPLGTAEQIAAYDDQLQEWLAATAGPRQELKQLEVTATMKAGLEKRMKFPAEVLEAIDTPQPQRTALQQQLCFFAERQIDIPQKDLDKALSPEQRKRRDDLKKEISKLESSRPRPPRSIDATIVLDGPEVPRTFLLAGGSYNKPEEEVQPGFLSAVSDLEAATITPPRRGTTGRRTALARWLIDPANPLPARVIVNRIWQGHFGKGIAENANDLGTQSQLPTHPELLDWLASEFVANGWSMKALHRLIMTSAVYRQSSDRTSHSTLAGVEKDPGNRLYWHFDRRRLEGESLRDSLLAVSGLLNPVMAGAGVRPELPPKFVGRDWVVASKPADRQRRSIYILQKRNLPYPFLQTFDQPDTFESCARRAVTNTGPQALTLMNSDSVIGYARAFAGQILADQPSADNATLIRTAFIRALSREPEPQELKISEQFLEKQSALLSARCSNGGTVLLPVPFVKFLDAGRGAALVDFCHALFNANEFLYVD